MSAEVNKNDVVEVLIKSMILKVKCERLLIQLCTQNQLKFYSGLLATISNQGMDDS